MPLPAPVMTAILSGVAIFETPIVAAVKPTAVGETSSSCAATSANSPPALRIVASITP